MPNYCYQPNEEIKPKDMDEQHLLNVITYNKRHSTSIQNIERTNACKNEIIKRWSKDITTSEPLKYKLSKEKKPRFTIGKAICGSDLVKQHLKNNG